MTDEQQKAGGGEGEEELAISMSDVQEAMKRIRPYVHYTPVMECSHLDSLAGLKLFFKCELFQKTGSFKVTAILVSQGLSYTVKISGKGLYEYMYRIIPSIMYRRPKSLRA